ncbi:AAA family ATPase [Candidatus Daviesbacteria bacterium]|nr:AAA family ATPase [Candidatus Daviesbacteria bacterium]
MDEELEKRLKEFEERKDKESKAKLEQLEKDWPLKERILAMDQMKAKERLDREIKELEEFEETQRELDSKFVPWKEFKSQVFEEPKWVIEGIIPEKGIAALAGSPESCKSLLSNFIALAVAKGETFLGKFPTLKKAVLIIDQENLPVWIQKRITNFTSEEDLPMYIFQSRKGEFKVENEDIFGQVKKFIKEKNIGLVIIDTLRLIHIGEENSSTALAPVIDKLKELSEFTAILLIHHNRKMDRNSKGKVGGEDMMGSIFIRGSLDSQLTLVKVTDPSDNVPRVRVTHTKSRYIQPIPTFDLTLEENDKQLLEFVYQDAPEEELLKREDAKGTILALLQEQDFTRQELIDQLKQDGICGQRTTETALAELQREGKVKHTEAKPHVYSLVESVNIPQSANPYIGNKIAESSEKISDDKQLDLMKGIFGEGTKWEEEK